jgi:hypothetical protein
MDDDADPVENTEDMAADPRERTLPAAESPPRWLRRWTLDLTDFLLLPSCQGPKKETRVCVQSTVVSISTALQGVWGTVAKRTFFDAPLRKPNMSGC